MLALYRVEASLDRLDGAALGSSDAGALVNASEQERETVASTLGVETPPPADCLVALGEREKAGLPRQQQQPPPLSCQVWALDEMSDVEFEQAIEAVLGPDGQSDALLLVPESYDLGSTSASAHNIFVTQRTEGGSLEDPDGFSENVTTAQVGSRDLATDRDRACLGSEPVCSTSKSTSHCSTARRWSGRSRSWSSSRCSRSSTATRSISCSEWPVSCWCCCGCSGS